jgi:uncharacterized protein (TIGR02757 family)
MLMPHEKTPGRPRHQETRPALMTIENTHRDMVYVCQEVKDFLEEKVSVYNNPGFIDTDPVFVPHQFNLKEDIEIAGFLAATLAWGSRKTIIRNTLRLMHLMGNAPYDFVMNHREHHLEKLDGFVHRTFNATDARFFVKALQHIYNQEGGLESIFTRYADTTSIIPAIEKLHTIFFSLPHPSRSRKHVSNPAKGSSSKRINMFLRWMVRKDNKGVDFGLWRSIPPGILSCPLDVHSGAVARSLGLLKRKQNDIKALVELDNALRYMDPHDPVKYDFALFGLGVFEKYPVFLSP